MDNKKIKKYLEENFMTTSQVADEFDVKVRTLTSYLARGQVIPDDRKIRVGGQWLIERKFAESKWDKRKE